MHEMSLLSDLLSKMQEIGAERNARKITAATVRLGALAHISPDHLREHFDHAVRGTSAEGAYLHVRENNDPDDPNAGDIILEEVEIET